MQDKQNNESLDPQNTQVIQAFKNTYIRDFNNFKNNLPIFIVLPSILGGIWQVLELSFIDTSYIRFFSINQIIPDGLLILFLSFYLFSIYNIITAALASLPFPRFRSDDFKDTSLIVFIIFSCLPFILVIPCYIRIYNTTFNSFFTILVNIFLLMILALLVLSIVKQIDLYTTHQNIKIKRIIFSFNFRMLVFTIFLLIFALPAFKMLNTARTLVNIPNNLNNFNKTTIKIAKENKLTSTPKLLYFNKDYLFYEIKVGNKKLIEIYETKNLFSDDSKKSKDD